MSTLEKNQSRLRTVDPSKSSQNPSSKVILSSLDFAFNMQNSNCALDEDSASVTIIGSRTNLGVPALTNLLPQTSLKLMLPPGLQSSHSWQWLIQKKKNSEPFRIPGILQSWGAAFWPTTWLLNGGNFCRVRITVTFSTIACFQ